jgi:hypothetical protein
LLVAFGGVPRWCFSDADAWLPFAPRRLQQRPKRRNPAAACCNAISLIAFVAVMSLIKSRVIFAFFGLAELHSSLAINNRSFVLFCFILFCALPFRSV